LVSFLQEHFFGIGVDLVFFIFVLLTGCCCGKLKISRVYRAGKCWHCGGGGFFCVSSLFTLTKVDGCPPCIIDITEDMKGNVVTHITGNIDPETRAHIEIYNNIN